MRKMRFVIGASLFVLLVLSLPVRAEYLMDCNKASTRIEKQICANREIWQLDGLLNRHYTAAKARGGDLDELREGQHRWLREVRDRCESDECLRKVYETRLDFLERWEFSDPYCGGNTYPPYPNVWGFDAGQYGASYGTIYKLPSGEAWFTYSSGNGGDQKWYLKCLFSGGLYTTKVHYPYSSYAGGHSLGSVVLPDGSTIGVGYIPSGRRCTSIFGSYLEKKGPDGSVENRIALLIKISEPHDVPYSRDCEHSLSDRDSITTYVVDGNPSAVVSLADGSVLVEGGDHQYPFVIRLNEALNTRFQSDKILVVEYADIELLRQQSRNEQELADLVYEYVTRKLKEE